jgi:pimeloyl-ACP methyl ester carboxylesterase
MRGEFVDVGGARLYYYACGTRGAGDPVVLLHGFPTSSHVWRDVTPLLPEGHRVVVLDMLGYGRSDRPAGHEVAIRAHAERAIGLMDALGIERACVAGHDLGGGVAQAMAVRWPQRVSGLGLVSSVAFDGWPVREVKMARAMLPLTRHLPPTWLMSAMHSDLERGYADGEAGGHSIERYLKPFAGADGRDAFVAHLTALDASETDAMGPRLKDIPCPSAIVWGAHDPFLPVALGRRLHEALPGSTFDVVADARHFVPEDAPERVAAALTGLLAR